MEYTTQRVQPVEVVHPVRPLLRLVGEMLAECGYPVMTAALVELLSTDLDLLAALQRLAFHRLAQVEGGRSCQ